MASRSLKRIALPRTWNVPRKSLNRVSRKFVSKPNPGKTLNLTVSLNTFLKEVVNVAKTKKEVKAALKNKTILVNSMQVKDEKFPVGLLDVVTLSDSDQSFRLVLSENGKLAGISIDAKEKDSQLKKVEGKTLIKGGKIQLNLFGSSNLTVDKDDYKIGDVLVVKDKKVESVLELKKGNTVLLTAGRHCGTIAVVEDIVGSKIVIKSDKNFETLKDYAYVIGEKSPIVKLRV